MNAIKNAINNSTTYSSNEIIIGTYIDDNNVEHALCRVTVGFTVSANATTYSKSTNITNLDFVLFQDYSIHRGTDYEEPYYASGSEYVRLFVRDNSGVTIEYRSSGLSTSLSVKATITYVKSV